MSTQQIRNIINNNIDSFLTRTKEDIRNEGKKRTSDLKSKIPKPQEISSKLKITPNDNTCSEQGREKFDKIYEKTHKSLSDINDIVKRSLTKIDDLEFKLNQLINNEGPFESLRGVEALMNSLMPLLKIIIQLAPALLGVLTGPAASHAAGDKIQERRKRAKSRVKEFSTAIASIPHLYFYYKGEAEKIIIPLRPIKSNLTFINNEIDKTLLFMHSFILAYEEKCNAHNSNPDANSTTTDDGGTVIIDPDGPTPLDEYLALLQQQYNDVYQALQETGNTKAIERIFALKENLEEDYNISFKVINL